MNEHGTTPCIPPLRLDQPSLECPATPIPSLVAAVRAQSRIRLFRAVLAPASASTPRAIQSTVDLAKLRQARFGLLRVNRVGIFGQERAPGRLFFGRAAQLSEGEGAADQRFFAERADRACREIAIERR